MENIIKEYDGRNNLIHYRSKSFEYFCEFNNNDMEVFYKDSNGVIVKKDYDSEGHIIFMETRNGSRHNIMTREYSDDGKLLHHKDHYAEQFWKYCNETGKIKSTKTILPNGKIISRHYDDKGN